MKIFAILFGLALSCSSFAQEFHLIEMEHLDFEAYQFENNRDGYAPYKDHRNAEGQEHWVNGAAMHWNVILAEYDRWALYWHNRVHMGNTNVQVRQAGWEWEFGAHLTEKFDLFWYHHSQHILEAKTQERYPLQNFYGFRINLYERDKK